MRLFLNTLCIKIKQFYMYVFKRYKVKTGQRKYFMTSDTGNDGPFIVVLSGYVEKEHMYIEDIYNYCTKHIIENCTECAIDDENTE